MCFFWVTSRVFGEAADTVVWVVARVIQMVAMVFKGRYIAF